MLKEVLALGQRLPPSSDDLLRSASKQAPRQAPTHQQPRSVPDFQSHFPPSTLFHWGTHPIHSLSTTFARKKKLEEEKHTQKKEPPSRRSFGTSTSFAANELEDGVWFSIGYDVLFQVPTKTRELRHHDLGVYYDLGVWTEGFLLIASVYLGVFGRRTMPNTLLHGLEPRDWFKGVVISWRAFQCIQSGLDRDSMAWYDCM